MFVMKFLGYANGQKNTRLMGMYLKGLEPKADGTCDIQSVRDPAAAMRFDSRTAAFEVWRSTLGTPAPGEKAFQPLMGYSFEIEEVTSDARTPEPV
jgi:hypothetical protein